jgi:hypothetical protein
MALVLPSSQGVFVTNKLRRWSRRDYHERLNLRRSIRRQLDNRASLQPQKDVPHAAN